MEKIDLEWIISSENNLTDKADSNFGNVYALCKDLLMHIQCIKSISRDNEVSRYFGAQILKNFYLAVLCAIRRHTNHTFFSLRQVIESISLFVYSMSFQKINDYNIIMENEQIIDYDIKILRKSYDFIKTKYPIFSRDLEIYKNMINYYYSHPNIFSSQYNSTIIDDKVKVLIFDSYYDDYIKKVLLTINEIIILSLKIYKKLEEDFKIYTLEENFELKLKELEARHEIIKEEILNQIKLNERANFDKIDDIINKCKEKYKDLLNDNYD
ncbi:MAG: hypothetical protein FJ216_01310 [Ignavibacteria bacterium]|nr:hypothetical protein [Ignavibacteria bacterium]